MSCIRWCGARQHKPAPGGQSDHCAQRDLGGIGTFEELFEVWTWRQLGYHDKPLGLLNVAGYYDGLLGFLQTSVASGFMGEWQMGLLHSGSDTSELLQSLVEQAGTNARQIPLRSVI